MKQKVSFFQFKLNQIQNKILLEGNGLFSFIFEKINKTEFNMDWLCFGISITLVFSLELNNTISHYHLCNPFLRRNMLYKQIQKRKNFNKNKAVVGFCTKRQ